MDIFLRAVFNKLNGAITYDSVPVPVYDEKKSVSSSANLYILLGRQTESDDIQDDNTFAATNTLEIEIWYKTGFETSKQAVHSVSNQILQLLIPTPYTSGLGVQDHFQFLNLRRTSAITQGFQITDTQTVLAKIITISAQIVQQSP